MVALDLSGKGFQNLITLPEQIKDLGQLTHLNLSSTQVSDINDLFENTELTQLDLSDTQVSDISPFDNLTSFGDVDLTNLNLRNTQVSDLLPLLPLTQLGKDPSGDGFNFDNTAAAKADPRIAKIADSKDRATALFEYLMRMGTTAENLERMNTRLGAMFHRLDALGVATEQRIENAKTQYEESFKAATQAYSEGNALAEPVILWTEKQKEHEENSDTARDSFYMALKATGLAVIIIAAILIFGTPVSHAIFTIVGCDLAKPETCARFSVRGLSILALLAMFFTCLLWYVRMQMKLFPSERHLALDARERKAFAQAYVGFLSDKGSSAEAAGQRSAVYAALFRLTTDGIVKDEGGLDPSIAAALSNFLTRSS